MSVADDRIEPGSCPRCGGPQLDLRGAGFNAKAVEKEETCFAWAPDVYTCLNGSRRRRLGEFRESVRWQTQIWS